MTDIVELLPCPFCGGPVELEQTIDKREWWGVVCRNTMGRGGTCAIQQRPSASKEAAVERWNTRAACEVMARSDGEWKEQHENLLAVRQQDITALTEARNKWRELCRRTLAYLPSTLGISKEIRAVMPPYDEADEPVFGSSGHEG